MRYADDAKSGVAVGQEMEGFRIERVVPMPEWRTTAIGALHERSGARWLHLHAPDDSENCFAALFPTPPPDDTGVPHILEHAVLAGSRKFPVREPFFEMLKISMATFLNAMTMQACTVYPVASNVKRDFFHLVEVYLDAVFHPLITEDIFRREGHHLALENNADLSSPLKLSGIVYSEMKGASSMPERLVFQLAENGLFPDSPLGRDSGGDPERIPELTFESFQRFYRDLYHPSNALLFTYGDIPALEHGRFLNPVLSEFERREVRTEFARPARWDAPRRIERPYPIGAEEREDARAFLTLNWAVGDALDPDAVMDWKMVSALLFGNDAAPLKKALIDAKLGADVFYAGSSENATELTFHAGIKGSESDRADAFEALVLDTLERLAADTFAPERVEAAFQQLAYETLEIQTLFPLHRMFAVASAWPYKGDPLTFLNMRKHWEACRARHAADPACFNRLIRTGLLDNPHRLLAVLRPDRAEQGRADASFAEQMSERRARLSEEQVAEIARKAADLAAAQSVPNTPEALATLPQLQTSDLPAKPRAIPTETGVVADVTLLRNDVFANGVNYLELDMDLAGLPVELYPWLPRYAEALKKLGAAGQDFASIAERRAACTGAFRAGARYWLHAADPATTLRRFSIGLKTLDSQADDAFGLLEDLLFSLDPRDRERLRDATVQSRAGYRTLLVNDGSGTAQRQAARAHSLAAALEHRQGGPDTLRDLETLAESFDARADELMETIERLRDFLALRARWTLSFTGSDSVFRQLTKRLEQWRARRQEPEADALPPFAPVAVPPREGLAGEMKIAHCAKLMPAPHLAHPDTPLLRLGAYLANFDYCLPEIRFKGNAYGAGFRHDDARGALCLTSFRDPNIAGTLAVFDGVRAWLESQRWSQTDIDRAIIGSAKEVEKPIRPGDATSAALVRHVRGDSDTLREARYAAMLRATPDTVRDTILRTLADAEPRASVCVVSSREKLADANRKLGAASLSVSDILQGPWGRSDP